MAKTKIKTVYKIKWKNLCNLLSIIVVALIILFGSIYLLKDNANYKKTEDVIKKISKNVKVSNIADDEKTSTIPPDSTLSKFDSYWKYIKLGLIEADMSSLKKINSDSIGFIEVKGTDFSYPVVQRDNEFYKTHSYDKKENSYGWIYLDEKNNIDSLDTNTIIYGNKQLRTTLFKDLEKLFDEEWNTNDDNFIIKYSTSQYSTLWQIISVYKTETQDHLKTTFDTDENLEAYIENIITKSEIKFKADARTSDKFLTLTTNSKSSNIVVHAKLIKIKKELD